jgi:hypothetical protein
MCAVYTKITYLEINLKVKVKFTFMLLVIFSSYDASACKCRNITLDESLSNSKAVLFVEIKSLTFTENSDRNPN